MHCHHVDKLAPAQSKHAVRRIQEMDSWWCWGPASSLGYDAMSGATRAPSLRPSLGSCRDPGRKLGLAVFTNNQNIALEAPYIFQAVVDNTPLRAIRRPRPVYLIAANLDGEFHYIGHCFVALRPLLPLSPTSLATVTHHNIHPETIVFNQHTKPHNGRKGKLTHPFWPFT